jgi:hypothetical protein
MHPLSLASKIYRYDRKANARAYVLVGYELLISPSSRMFKGSDILLWTIN